ncbi:MAG: molybdenum cofactor guanylyltransferase [Leptolyngbya sp. DLM2.Bin27]|nr:MAG: molybdenum cofactor guanylyltransferase [Leptolyngbya sp. DLM2.Bin27]
MTTVAAVILAGGRSSRMGHDKALIALSPGAETLIQRVCRVALACADGVTVITPWGDRYRPLLPASVKVLVEQSALNPERSPGPVVALGQALSELRAAAPVPDWVLLLACDMPNLSAAVLGQWRDQLAEVAPEAVAYLPQRQGRWEPLAGFYRVSALADLQTYIDSGGRSFQPWLNQRPVTPIALTKQTAATLINLNTPTDLAQWQRQATP